MDTKAYVSEVREAVRANKPLWRGLEKDGVVSYAWLARFAGGDFDNPGIFTVEKVKHAIDEARKSPKRRRNTSGVKAGALARAGND